jgi:HrpA-like RNA helicase
MGPHLFCPSPPVVSIEGRQFPVETHWLRVTPDDLSSALEAAVKTVATVHNTLPRGTVLVFLPGKREIVAMTRDLRERFAEDEMVIVPLHSGNPTFFIFLFLFFPLCFCKGMEPAQQQLAFKEPPDNARLVILATNIAECSLTLPNIRYVVDPGYAREQVWGDDAGGGVFATRRISQASAMQVNQQPKNKTCFCGL